MTVLLWALEPGRSGPARLPQYLQTAGILVVIASPVDNTLYHTSACKHRFAIPHTKSGWRLAHALDTIVRRTRPTLIIPADEQALAMLRAIMIGPFGHLVGSRTRDLIARSLPPLDMLDVLLFKSDTVALARKLGLPVPDSTTVASFEQARAVADRVGYPLFLKHSFSWAGAGVVKCTNQAELAAAFGAMQARPGRLKALVRTIIGRDWYPATAPIDIQAPIAGHPAMYCALAWHGRLAAGFAGEPLALSHATGPSTAVRVGAHPGMQQMVQTMIQATGATGLIGFDFMIGDADGQPYLIECNARPIQISHLGYRIGVDIAVELHRLMNGGAVAEHPLMPTRSIDVSLFPMALNEDAIDPSLFRDIPGADPGLMEFGRVMLADC